MATIDELVAGDAQDVEHQPIAWRRPNWEELWKANPGLPGREVLDAIDAEVSGRGAGTIRRSWIRGLAEDDPAVFLAASTIWGFGNRSVTTSAADTSGLHVFEDVADPLCVRVFPREGSGPATEDAATVALTHEPNGTRCAPPTARTSGLCTDVGLAGCICVSNRRQAVSNPRDGTGQRRPAAENQWRNHVGESENLPHAQPRGGQRVRSRRS